MRIIVSITRILKLHDESVRIVLGMHQLVSLLSVNEGSTYLHLRAIVFTPRNGLDVRFLAGGMKAFGLERKKACAALYYVSSCKAKLSCKGLQYFFNARLLRFLFELQIAQVNIISPGTF